MLHNKEIVPWRCHVCNRTFDALGGGICRRCGRPTCNVCFLATTMKRLIQFKLPAIRTCRKCAEKKETPISPEIKGNAKYNQDS